MLDSTISEDIPYNEDENLDYNIEGVYKKHKSSEYNNSRKARKGYRYKNTYRDTQRSWKQDKNTHKQYEKHLDKKLDRYIPKDITYLEELSLVEEIGI